MCWVLLAPKLQQAMDEPARGASQAPCDERTEDATECRGERAWELAEPTPCLWDSSPSRHRPPQLRGQKTLHRAEPWSHFADETPASHEPPHSWHDCDRAPLPSIVQPAWDSSKTLGRCKYKPGDAEADVCRRFRELRKADSAPVYLALAEPR